MDAALGEPGTMAWAAVMPRIAQHRRAIAYDRAGLGLSDPAVPLTLDTSIGDLAALAAHAGVAASWSAIAGAACSRSSSPSRPRNLSPGWCSSIRPRRPTGSRCPLRSVSRATTWELCCSTSIPEASTAISIRDAFQRFAKLLTEDPGQQARILDAYVACYSKRSQVEAFPAEFRLFDASIPEIHRIRAEGALPDVPIVVLSATEGAREDHRKAWTKLHAELAASVPRGRHVILADTDHAVDQAGPGAVAEAIESVSGVHP